MGNQAVSYQSPRPEVVIWRPDNVITPIFRFDTLLWKSLQSYSFGTSLNDIKERFTLIFHPDDEKFANSEEKETIFAQIQVMDIVENIERDMFYLKIGQKTPTGYNECISNENTLSAYQGESRCQADSPDQHNHGN